MRKLIVQSFITLNGVIQAPGGPEEDTSGGFTYGGWQAPYSDEVVGKVLDEEWREPFDLLVYGSGNFIQTLLKHDLIDEFWLKIYPITLGTGKRLFAEGTIPVAFKVTKGPVSPTGVIVAYLEQAGEVQTGTVGE